MDEQQDQYKKYLDARVNAAIVDLKAALADKTDGERFIVAAVNAFKEDRFVEAIRSGYNVASSDPDINVARLIVALSEYKADVYIYFIQTSLSNLLKTLREIPKKDQDQDKIFEIAQALIQQLTLDYAVKIVTDVIENKDDARHDLVTVDDNKVIKFAADSDKYINYQILKALNNKGLGINYIGSLEELDVTKEDASLFRKINRQIIFKDPSYEGTYERGQFYGTYASWKCVKAAGMCAAGGFLAAGGILFGYFVIPEFGVLMLAIGVAAAASMIMTSAVTLSALAAVAVSPLGLAAIALTVCLVAAVGCLIAAAACLIASPVMGLVNSWIGNKAQDEQADPLLGDADAPVAEKPKAAEKQKVFKWQHVKNIQGSLKFFPEVIAQPAAAGVSGELEAVSSTAPGTTPGGV